MDHSVLWLLFLANAIVGLIGYMRHVGLGFNFWFAIAKTGGYILDFDLSLLLLPTLRSAQTIMRQVSALERIFSDPIHFHIQVACFVLFGTCVHVIGHVFHLTAIAKGPVFFPATTPNQEISGTPWWLLILAPSKRAAPLTGIFILQLMVPMFLTAIEKVRRHTFDFTQLPRTCKDIQAWFILLMVGFFMWPILLYRRFSGNLPTDPDQRKKVGGFRIFWAMHMNWLPVYMLLLVHGPNFWIWFLWPMVMVLCDRLLQKQRRQTNVRLYSVELLKSYVMKLTFVVPKGFDYQAGQYLQLCCRQMGAGEWHPFTISSAPEEDYLTVHIRCPDELDWCSALRKRLVEHPVSSISQGAAKAKPGCRVLYNRRVHHGLPKDVEEDLNYDQPHTVEVPRDGGGSMQTFTAPKTENLKKSNTGLSKISLSDIAQALPKQAVQLQLDGPHGAPSQSVWRHRSVVLVGAGIGVTPFASILRSTQLRPKKATKLPSSGAKGASAWRQKLFTDDTSNASPSTAEEEGWQPCETIYFYWLCRGQEEFEWFYGMLSEAIGSNKNRQIEVNLFQTGEIELTKVKALGCGFQQYFGRPNWGRIFFKMAEEHPKEEIGVFLCGPSAIRRDLQQGATKAKGPCAKHGSSFTIYAENF